MKPEVVETIAYQVALEFLASVLLGLLLLLVVLRGWYQAQDFKRGKR